VPICTIRSSVNCINENISVDGVAFVKTILFKF
jgi:hypothetical protein